MKHMVIGGAGFIGSNLIRELLERGVKKKSIMIYDNYTSGFEKFEGIETVELNVLNKSILKKAMKKFRPDMVWHLAANADIQKGTEETDLDLTNGTLATHCVLECMRLSGIKNIIFTSSSAIYGIKQGHIKESTGPCTPISLYGASKLAAEGLISAYSHLYGINAWIFRLGNIIGVGQTHGFLYDMIIKIKGNKKEIEVLGDGSQEKSYLHISDCVDGMLFLQQVKTSDRLNIYNLSSDDTINVKNILTLLLIHTGLKLAVNYTGGKQGWKGDIPKFRLEVHKSKQEGWYPIHTSLSANVLAIKELCEELNLKI